MRDYFLSDTIDDRMLAPWADVLPPTFKVLGANLFADPFVVDERCYAFTISPVFQQGRYEAGNVWVSPISEWLGVSGELHARIRDMPDGASVRVAVETAPADSPAGRVAPRRFGSLFGRRRS